VSTLAPAEIVVTVAPRRVPASADEPTTLVEVFERVARVHKRPDTLNYKRDGQWHAVSSDEMLARVQRVAAGLHAIGVRPGDRVALLSESRVEWTLTDAGCVFAGAISVPIYPTLPATQVAYILRDSGARALLISNHEKFMQVRDALRDCATVQQVVFFDAAGVEPADGITFAQLEEKGRALNAEQPKLVDEIAHCVKPDDLTTIIYTSGTTGEPKGVMLTNANLVSNLIDSSAGFSFVGGDIVLSVLPLSHVFERQAMYMYLYRGITVFYGESLDALGRNLREVRPTVLVGVPRIFEKIFMRMKDKAAAQGRVSAALLAWAISVTREYAVLAAGHKQIPWHLTVKHELASRLAFSKLRQSVGGRLRIFISGGAALSEELGYIFWGAGLPIVQGYGLTETSPVISANTIEENRIGTVGRPIPNVEVRIAADGEIETRGPNVMNGYYNKPAETSAVFTADGWFKTGDIGTLDADGFLRITDRKKELFKTSGGKYIAPQPIEQLIKGSRFVNQVVLIGNGRKFPAALIVPDWERVDSYLRLKGLKSSSRAELCRNARVIDVIERQIAALTPGLAQYERVKKIALIENEFTIEGGELTPTLKVKRRVIDEKYRAVIDRLYDEAEAGRA
jgi:long-chain acyl-CoA synthetase